MNVKPIQTKQKNTNESANEVSPKHIRKSVENSVASRNNILRTASIQVQPQKRFLRTKTMIQPLNRNSLEEKIEMEAQIERESRRLSLRPRGDERKLKMKLIKKSTIGFKEEIRSRRNKKTLKYSTTEITNWKAENIKFLMELSEQLNDKDLLEKKTKSMKTFGLLLFYSFSILINIISIILFIIDSQISDSDFDLKNTLNMIDFYLAWYFCSEFLFAFITSEDKLNFIFSWETAIDLLSIIPSIVTYYTETQTNVSFLRIIRVFKILRILRLFRYLQLIPSNFDAGNSYEVRLSNNVSITKITTQMINLGIVLIATFFITAGLIILVQDLAPEAYNHPNLTFLDAFYFVIITSSTIGYGDVYPVKIYSRIFTIMMIIVLIYIFSDQISKIVELLQISDLNDISYNFTDHIIVFGKLNPQSLKYFINELYRGFYANEKLKEKEIPYCIIMNELGNEISFNNAYKKKICFLKTSKYNVENFMKVNFQEARSIYVFNQDYSANPIYSDKELSYYLKNFGNLLSIIANPQKEKRDLFIQYLLSEETLETNCIQTSLSIPYVKLKCSLMAKSVFCKGFSTFFFNLLSKKKPMKLTTMNYYLNHYIQGLNMKIQIVDLPDNFNGMSFPEAYKLIHKHVLSKYKKMTPNNTSSENKIGESSNEIHSLKDQENYIEENSNKDSVFNNSLIFLGLQRQKIIIKSTKKKLSEKRTSKQNLTNKDFDYLFNPPLTEKIGKNNSGIFITDKSELEIKLILDSIKTEINEYNNSISSLPILKRSTSINAEKLSQETLNDAIKKKFKEYNNNNLIYLKDNENINIDQSYYDLSINSYYYPKMMNHIVIFGFNIFIDCLIYELRKYSLHNPILIIDEVIVEEYKRIILKKYKNVLIVQGDYLNLANLVKINIHKALYVIIFTSKNPNTKCFDANALNASRIIEQFFNDTPYIVEMVDLDNLNLLGSIPLAENIDDEEEISYIYPNFMEGKFFFSSDLNKLAGIAYSNNNEVSCLCNLVRSTEDKELEQNSTDVDIEHKSSRLINENLINQPFSDQDEIIDHFRYERLIFEKTHMNLFSLDIPLEYQNKKYSFFLDELIQCDTLLIPFGVYINKTEINEGHDDQNNFTKIKQMIDMNKSPSKRKRNSIEKLNLLKGIKNSKFSSIKTFTNDVYDAKVAEYVDLNSLETPLFITNPPYDMIMTNKMTLLCFGEIKKVKDIDNSHSYSIMDSATLLMKENINLEKNLQLSKDLSKEMEDVLKILNFRMKDFKKIYSK